MKRLLNVISVAFSFRGVTVEQSFDHDSIDRMPTTGPGFLLFHYDSLLGKVYRRDTRDSSSSV